MASGLLGMQVSRKGLWVRVPCPPLCCFFAMLFRCYVVSLLCCFVAMLFLRSPYWERRLSFCN